MKITDRNLTRFQTVLWWLIAGLLVILTAAILSSCATVKPGTDYYNESVMAQIKETHLQAPPAMDYGYWKEPAFVVSEPTPTNWGAVFSIMLTGVLMWIL